MTARPRLALTVPPQPPRLGQLPIWPTNASLHRLGLAHGEQPSPPSSFGAHSVFFMSANLPINLENASFTEKPLVFMHLITN